jgi:ubiquinone biosynthesis protein Coq4
VFLSVQFPEFTVGKVYLTSVCKLKLQRYETKKREYDMMKKYL